MYVRKKIKKGKTYYYLVKNERVDGKPRVVWQKYLGSAERIESLLANAQQAGVSPDLHSFSYGRTAALLHVNEELGFSDVIDKHAKLERIHGLTVGEYILLLIMGRCDGPVSKNGMEDWFKGSPMSLLWSFNHSLSSQNFLNHMKRLDEIESGAEEEIAGILLAKGLKPFTLFWDRTNYYTFIEHGGKLPRKGHSKQHRNDKNLIDLGIVAGNEGIPLLHTVDEANLPDSKSMPVMLDRLTERLGRLGSCTKDLTLVFDKGNNSELNIRAVIDKMHVVGSITHTQAKELIDIPLDKYQFLYENLKKHKVYGYRTEKEIFGVPLTVVISYNEGTKKRQQSTYERNRQRILGRLADLKKRLESESSQNGSKRRRTASSIEREINDIITKNMRSVVSYKLTESKNSKSGFALDYSIDEGKERCRYDAFGKNVIFTDNREWPSEKIVKTYNSKNVIENNFRWFNNTALLPMRPFFVHNDASIRSHISVCVAGMLFYRYLFRHLEKFRLTGEQILKELDGIRLAAVKNAATGKVHLVFEDMTPIQAQLFSYLDLGRFVKSKQ